MHKQFLSWSWNI